MESKIIKATPDEITGFYSMDTGLCELEVHNEQFSAKKKFAEITDEELVKELLRRKTVLPNSVIHTIIDNSGYIAAKLWSPEDVGCELTEFGYEDCIENIGLVIDSGLLCNLSDCTDEEWDIIRYAINACADNLLRLSDISSADTGEG